MKNEISETLNRHITDDKQRRNSVKPHKPHTLGVSSNLCRYEAAKWIESDESYSIEAESDTSDT